MTSSAGYLSIPEAHGLGIARATRAVYVATDVRVKSAYAGTGLDRTMQHKEEVAHMP